MSQFRFSRGVCALQSLFGAASIAAAGSAQVTLQVPVTSNLHAAGHLFPEAPVGGGAGILPPMIRLPKGIARSFTVSNVTGLVSFCPGCGNNQADGTAIGSICTVSSWRGISAYRTSRTRALMGVALTAAEPVDPAPPPIVWDASAVVQPTISFQTRQIFFVGDGFTGTGSGSVQTFIVPEDATRFFLGFVDGYCGQAHGTYGDDSGSLIASVSYTGCLWLLEEPISVSACLTGSATLNVETAGVDPIDYQWQYDAGGVWHDVSDGAIPGLGGAVVASGSATNQLDLTLNAARGTPPVRFRCIVTNSCGSVTSEPAALIPCQSDLTCDNVVDDEDFVVFAAAYNLLDCADPAMAAGCQADLNGDGLVDDADFVLFVAAYNELGCI